MRARLGRWITVGVALVLGLVFAGGTWSLLAEYRALRLRGVQAEALVVDHEETSSRFGRRHFPVLRFAAEGRERDATSRIEADPAALPAGRRIVVVYDPEDPSRVRPADTLAEGPGLLPWITAGLAMFFLASAVAAAGPRGLMRGARP